MLGPIDQHEEEKKKTVEGEAPADQHQKEATAGGTGTIFRSQKRWEQLRY